MSDESKVEALDGDEQAPEAMDAVAVAPRRELIRPEHLALLRKILPAAWLLGVIATGITSGIELSFLVAAAGVLVAIIALMWSSVQSLTGGTSLGFEEALGMGAPSKVEEQKRSILRALKDLDFERGVGKISPEDYAELSARYRTEAKRLMQTLDEALEPARKQVEAQLLRRLEREGLTAEPEKTPEIPAKPAETAAAAPAAPADKLEDES